MSGQSGRYFFLALFCCYVFASVLPHLESVPGSGKFITTYADARLAPVTWRLEWQSVVSGRLMSGQVDPGRSRSIQVVWFSFFLAIVWLGLRAFARCLCWVMGSLQAWKGPPSHPDSLPSGSHGFMMMKIRSQQCLFTFRHRAFVSLFFMQLPCVNGAMVLVRESASRFGSQDSPGRAPTRGAPTDPRRIGTVPIRCNCPCVWACYVVR